jgi:hypothetical protein
MLKMGNGSSKNGGSHGARESLLAKQIMQHSYYKVESSAVQNYSARVEFEEWKISASAKAGWPATSVSRKDIARAKAEKCEVSNPDEKAWANLSLVAAVCCRSKSHDFSKAGRGKLLDDNAEIYCPTAFAGIPVLCRRIGLRCVAREGFL